MLKSMTGYGRAHLQRNGIQLTVEVLSVNRKHLDINVILPRHLNRFDPEIRKEIANVILRGHVTVRVSVVFLENAPLAVDVNLAMAAQYYKGWAEIAKTVGIDQNNLSLSLLEKETDLFVYKETEGMQELSELLLDGVKDALVPFCKMREGEGAVLAKDIGIRIFGLMRKLEKIKEISKGAVERYQHKLLEKIRGLIPEVTADDDRFLKEVLLFAERIDIEEEIIRFSSHLEQAKELLEKGPLAAGKTLEFLVQELGREINTIGSKCGDVNVTKLVIDVKTELERVREQIQNIE